MPETTTEANLHADDSLSDLRSSLKWLVVASGAVAAVLVTGLQLSSIPGDDLPGRRWLSIGTISVALLLVFAFLYVSVRVMTLPRPTTIDLVNRESRANVPATLATGAEIKDGLIRWMYANRSRLLKGEPSLNDLYTVNYVQAAHALGRLSSDHTAAWNGKTFHADQAEDVQRLRDTVSDAGHTLIDLESAAHLELTTQRYRALMRAFPVGAVLFVGAVVLFATATHIPPADGANIASSVPVQVIVTDREAAGLPQSCLTTELRGVAIGGTLDKPTVVSAPAPGCPAQIIKQGKGIVAVPTFPQPSVLRFDGK